LPTLKENFEAIGHAKVFRTLNLCFDYHHLDIKRDDKEKITFFGIDKDKKNQL